MTRYLANILIGIDQLITTLLGGWPDETLSSYAWRLDYNGRIFGTMFRPAIDWAFRTAKNQPDHCYQSYLSEIERRQMPMALR